MSDTHNTAETQFLDTNSIRYAYRRFGSGNKPPLLCLQHFRGGLDNWDPQVTDGLARGRSVILFNNAGIASSSGRPANNIAEMATHVIAFLDALELKEIDLLGFSMGGFIAQQVTLDRPQIIRRLILAGTGPQGGGSTANPGRTPTAQPTPRPSPTATPSPDPARSSASPRRQRRQQHPALHHPLRLQPTEAAARKRLATRCSPPSLP